MRRSKMMTVQTQQVSATQTHVRQRRNWPRWVSVGVLGLILVSGAGWPLTVTAADVPAPAANQETYVMISIGWGLEFFAWSFAGMSDAAALLGPHVKVEWQGPKPFSEAESSLQANIMKATIKRQVSGIVLTAVNKTIFKPVIDEAIGAGIPVICFDSDVPGSKRLAVVATDNYRAGYLAGTTMAEWLNGQGSIGMMRIKNVTHLEERFRGFKDGLASISPATEIFVIEKEGGFNLPLSEIAYDYKVLLKAHPDIKGLFCPWVLAGIAAVEAARNLDLIGDIQILSFDYNTETIQAIEQGEIRATVAQNPYLMGYYSLLLAYSAAHPTAIPSHYPGFGHVPANIDTGAEIIGKAEVARYKHVPKVKVQQDPPLIYGF